MDYRWNDNILVEGFFDGDYLTYSHVSFADAIANIQYKYYTGFGNGYFDDKVEFNSDKYVKPNPYYGLIHDKYVKPSDNANNIAKIEKDKTIIY